MSGPGHHGDEPSPPPAGFRRECRATPIGDFTVFTDWGVVVAATFEPPSGRMERWLQQYRCGHARPADDSASPPTPATQAIIEYFAGRVDALACLPVEHCGTPFQRDVWAALRTVPAGSTETYGGLAKRIDRPSAVRAVGLASGANPIPIIVPCHRIVGSDGSLTGYGSGLERKRWLLDHERRNVGVPASASGPGVVAWTLGI